MADKEYIHLNKKMKGKSQNMGTIEKIGKFVKGSFDCLKQIVDQDKTLKLNLYWKRLI